MADIRKQVPEDVPGEFFVDTTCIDCDTCRQLAPQVFREGSDHAFVHAQPTNDAERRAALRALVSCPTGSIGHRRAGRTNGKTNDPTKGKKNGQTDGGPVSGHAVSIKEVFDDFPLLLEAPVYYCGFNSPKSYGGNSYLLRHPDGNWLIDSPKFLPQLAGRIDRLGGVASIFLTHRDDVVDAARYAEHFGSRRFIHRLELASQPGAEVVLEGFDPIELAPDVLAIPTPGHTAGHCVLLYAERFLFTGDHLSWDRDRARLSASRDYCWHSWPKQLASLERLADFRFEWILPGHGQRIHLPAGDMQRELKALVQRLRKG